MDFSILFKNIDADIFKNTWGLIKDHIQYILEQKNGAENFSTMYNDDVEQLLMILKLFPARFAKGSTRLNFKQSIEKLIVFQKVSFINSEFWLPISIVIYSTTISRLGSLHSMQLKTTINSHT